MNKLFYPKLAVANLRKNRKIYLPYILSCIGTVMMYYIMYSLSDNQGLIGMRGGDNLKILLTLGTNVIGIFAFIFLFYTNSFLIKRRKKEFGLLNILGMEKKHITKMVFFETLYVAGLSLVGGIVGGVLLSKLVQLALLKMLNTGAQFGFYFSMAGLLSVLLIFGGVFGLTFLNTLRQIHLSNPIDLLKGGQIGEKEPKSNWLLSIGGVFTLGLGYYIALTVQSPMMAVNLFFVAVIFVIIGTNLLFVSGSTVLLKALRKNKGYYYQTKHFIAISGLIYRMKQNAVGLANICILSTAVLVMLSTTFSLYVGMEDVLRDRFPRDISLHAWNISAETAQTIDGIVLDECLKQNILPENAVRYRSKGMTMVQEGADFHYDADYNYMTLADKMRFFTILPVDEYNLMMNAHQTLRSNEVMIYGNTENLGETITIGGQVYQIKECLTELKLNVAQTALADAYYLVMSDQAVMEALFLEAGQWKEPWALDYSYGFDLADGKSQETLALAIQGRLNALEQGVSLEYPEEARQDFYILYGGLFFIGIFLGVLFVMATVLIMYYKQVSEGYDDKERFEIMQKVGLSRSEIKATINAQVLIVFFLPLLTAGIHIMVGFPIMTKMLAMLNLSNVTLFAGSTIGTFVVFALLYTLIYRVTARVYYKIVS